MQEADAYTDTSGEEEATKLPPYRALSMQALNHTAGYLPVSGTAAALCKTLSI